MFSLSEQCRLLISSSRSISTYSAGGVVVQNAYPHITVRSDLACGEFKV